MSVNLRRLLWPATLIAALLPFQNCSSAPEEDSTSVSSFAATLPHAYDAKLDTIAYMSCSGINEGSLPKRAYFSFRAGAYNRSSGGLMMTDSFREKTKNYDNTRRARAFSESDANATALLNFSIRQSGNLRAPWKEGEFLFGEEIDTFLPPLASAEIAGPLASAAPGARVNYFPGSQDQRLMEASLRLYRYENTVKDLRNALASNAMLVAGYSASLLETDTELRGPDENATDKYAYGTGYKMSFRLPRNYSTGESRVINSISEMDLSTDKLRASTWDCDVNFQFMVVRPEDVAAGRVICSRTPDPAGTAAQISAMTAIRRVLRVEDWFVDINDHCVVPKHTGDYCYGEMRNRTVKYSLNCTHSEIDGGEMCPHFVSVCLKRN